MARPARLGRSGLKGAEGMPCVARITLKLNVVALFTLRGTGIERRSKGFIAIQHPFPSERMAALHELMVLLQMAFPAITRNNAAAHPYVLARARFGAQIGKLQCLLDGRFGIRINMACLTPNTLSGVCAALPICNPTVRHASFFMATNAA